MLEAESGIRRPAAVADETVDGEDAPRRAQRHRHEGDDHRRLRVMEVAEGVLVERHVEEGQAGDEEGGVGQEPDHPHDRRNDEDGQDEGDELRARPRQPDPVRARAPAERRVQELEHDERRVELVRHRPEAGDHRVELDCATRRRGRRSRRRSAPRPDRSRARVQTSSCSRLVTSVLPGGDQNALQS